MNTRGFALLAVLWTLAAVTALTGAAISVARLGSSTTRNRILLARAGWAREACVEILLARYAQDPALRGIDPVDLGRGTWCDAKLEDPATKVNVNLADRAALVTVLRAVAPARAVDSLADAVLERRRHDVFADVAELAGVRGFTDSFVAQLSRFVTTRGTGVINVNAAPPEVLATLPGMTEETLELILARRGAAALASVDVLAGWLSPGARATLLASYPELVRAATFMPPELVGVVQGGVRGTSLVARVTLTVVPVTGRLAVIRRETE